MMDKLTTHLEQYFTLPHYDERRATHAHARVRPRGALAARRFTKTRDETLGKRRG